MPDRFTVVIDGAARGRFPSVRAAVDDLLTRRFRHEYHPVPCTPTERDVEREWVSTRFGIAIQVKRVS